MQVDDNKASVHRKARMLNAAIAAMWAVSVVVLAVRWTSSDPSPFLTVMASVFLTPFIGAPLLWVTSRLDGP